MASSQESRIPVYDTSERSEPSKATADEGGMAAVAQVEVLTSTRSTSPVRSSSSTRKFFQDKVHEVVRRARYGQWDFDFSASPSAASSADDHHMTVPPWGPVSAKDIFSGILRPVRNHDDPDWKYTRNDNGDSPRSPASMRAYADLE